MAPPRNQTDWQLHLDRRSDRCVLRRAGEELPILGTYQLEQTSGQQILRLRLPVPSSAPGKIPPKGAV